MIAAESCNKKDTESVQTTPQNFLPVDKSKDIGGFFDPVLKMLFVTKEDEDNILKTLSSEKLNDSEYVMPWKTISGNPMQISFQTQTASQQLIFLYLIQAERNVSELLAGDDTSRAEFVEDFTTGTGTYARLYRNGKCITVQNESSSACNEIVEFTFTLTPKFKFSFEYYLSPDSTKKFPPGITIRRTGKYSLFKNKTVKNCLKGGSNYCVEELSIVRTEEIYADKNCSQLIETKPAFGYSCR